MKGIRAANFRLFDSQSNILWDWVKQDVVKSQTRHASNGKKIAFSRLLTYLVTQSKYPVKKVNNQIQQTSEESKERETNCNVVFLKNCIYNIVLD
jgi:hypothetical protein